MILKKLKKPDFLPDEVEKWGLKYKFKHATLCRLKDWIPQKIYIEAYYQTEDRWHYGLWISEDLAPYMFKNLKIDREKFMKWQRKTIEEFENERQTS